MTFCNFYQGIIGASWGPESQTDQHYQKFTYQLKGFFVASAFRTVLRLFHWPFPLPGTLFPDLDWLLPSFIRVSVPMSPPQRHLPWTSPLKSAPSPSLPCSILLSSFLHSTFHSLKSCMYWIIVCLPWECKLPQARDSSSFTGACPVPAQNRCSVDVRWMEEWIGPKGRAGCHILFRKITEKERQVLNLSKKKCEVLFLPYFSPIMLRLIWLMNQFLKTHNGVTQLSQNNQHRV